MCKFAAIPIGQPVELKVDPGKCSYCGKLLAFSGKATYRGHYEADGIVYDVFYINSACCRCGEDLGVYQEICESQEPLAFDFIELN